MLKGLGKMAWTSFAAKISHGLPASGPVFQQIHREPLKRIRQVFPGLRLPRLLEALLKRRGIYVSENELPYPNAVLPAPSSACLFG